MDKKSIIAFILIGIILILWPLYQRKVIGVKPASVGKQNEPTNQMSKVREEAKKNLSSREEDQKNLSTTIKDEAVTQRIDNWENVKADTILIENNLFRGSLSSIGGGTIISWKLKKYFGDDGKWVELIPDSAQGNLGITTRLIIGMDLQHIVFDVASDTEWVEKGKKFRKICFVKNLFEKGGLIEKEFMIYDDRYDIEMNVKWSTIQNPSTTEGYNIIWTSGLSPTEKRISEEVTFCEAYALQGGELLKTKEVNTGQREGTTDWVAIRSKYFLVALIPREPLGQSVQLEGEKVNIISPEGRQNQWRYLKARLGMPLYGIPVEKSRFIIFLGPMDYQLLKKFGVQLEKMMNFGMILIKPFSIAFFYTLQFLYKLVHNYGWAIVIFSILIKLLLHPLTRKSFQSIKQMQELQPKLNEIRERYKKDQQRMNQETMKLYKQHGVNPMGGCLPMLLQMPVLFALFNLFRTTIMLRQASYLGLIKDLSAPDAIFSFDSTTINILPILMGLSMIIQQRMSVQDPKQKAMVYIMPLFMIFIFYKLSAGLNLYYLMFNILTIAHEMIMKRNK